MKLLAGQMKSVGICDHVMHLDRGGVFRAGLLFFLGGGRGKEGEFPWGGVWGGG